MGAIRGILFGLTAVLFSPYFLPTPLFISDVKDLPTPLQEWYKRGRVQQVNGHNLFYIHQRCTNSNKKNPATFVIIHGFPSSTFEYHKVIAPLLSYGNVLMHDHVGFGFSDKPTDNFTYSLGEAAENSLALWRKEGVKRAHVIAHDMGDSILTEILARRHRGLLPDFFNNFFQSITFTNGGMKYSMINFRIGQTLASNVYFGKYFNTLSVQMGLNAAFLRRQLVSIWGPAHDVIERDRDISSIEELVSFRGGSAITHKIIYYLWDRAHFEFRWFEALGHIDVRTRFIWANSDAVSPVSIPQFFEGFVPGAEVGYVEGAGHFFMLEKPNEWIRAVVEVLK